MMHIRMVANIPLSAIPPGATEPVVMTEEERTIAINAAAAMVDQIEDYSEGMCTVDMDIVLIEGPITEAQYSEFNGQFYISPAKTAIFVGNRHHYDYPCTYATPAQMPTMTSFRGIAISGGYLGKLMSGCDLTVGPHELAHLLEGDIRPQGYTNFPNCAANTGGTQAIHCGPTYGYPTNLEPEFFELFYSGDLPDGTGIAQAGWDTQTPTEQGLKTIEPRRVPERKSTMPSFRVVPQG